FTFTGFSDKDFGDLIEHWSWVYVKDIKPFLKQGNNVIKIAAANNDESDGKYDQTNNPAGLIFATTFEVAKGGKDNVFVNKLKPIEPVCNIDNSKLVEVVNEAKTLYNNECYETGALEALVAEAESYSGCEQDVIDGYTNSIRETIDNLIDYCAVGGAMSSVTATNDAGAPHVANNNNFTFAVIDRADLENGVELDLVLGAKYVKVGTVSVILNSDGNIEITGIKDVDGKSVSAQSYGMLAYNQEIEYGTNLNPLIKHDNKSVESPEGDTIYLYIHFDNLQFFLNK
ncbi:MAG: hypothetical protein LBE56_10635, partial [Tannerella sp.]|nr:hypothetical protein [Tannerella sp.]